MSQLLKMILLIRNEICLHTYNTMDIDPSHITFRLYRIHWEVGVGTENPGDLLAITQAGTSGENSLGIPGFRRTKSSSC